MILPLRIGIAQIQPSDLPAPASVADAHKIIARIRVARCLASVASC